MMDNQLVEIEGSKVYHIIRRRWAASQPRFPCGETRCRLTFNGTEIVTASTRKLCGNCKRATEKAIADDITAEHIIDDAHDKLEALR